MKKFLLWIIFYSLLLFSLLFVFEIITSGIVDNNSDYKLESKPHYLVVGHSHAEMTYNDSLISNFKNLAESGEAYFYTYYKLKKVLEKNPSITTVFLEFSNNNIDKKMNGWTWGDVDMSYRLEKFAPLIGIKGKLFLLSKNPLGYIKSLVVISKGRIEQIGEGHLIFDRKLGGYKRFSKIEEQNANKISDVDGMPKNIENYEISNENLIYFNKIIQLCEKRRIKLILIRSPQRSDYEFWGNEEIFQKILKNDYGNLDFIDFSRFKLNSDEYLNAAHLNSKGATYFSNWFNTVLQSGQLKPENRMELNKLILQTQH